MLSAQSRAGHTVFLSAILLAPLLCRCLALRTHQPLLQAGEEALFRGSYLSVVAHRSGFKSDRCDVGSRLPHLLITTSSISRLFTQCPYLQNSHSKG